MGKSAKEARTKANELIDWLEKAEKPANPVIFGAHMVINDLEKYIANLKNELLHARPASRLERSLFWRIFELKKFLDKKK